MKCWSAVRSRASGIAVSVRTRARMERPFLVVQALLKQAQQRFLQKEQALQEQLTVTEQRLRELETRKQLKLVRRNLRKDIKALGLRVKWNDLLKKGAIG